MGLTYIFVAPVSNFAITGGCCVRTISAYDLFIATGSVKGFGGSVDSVSVI